MVGGVSLPCTDREGIFLRSGVHVVSPVDIPARSEWLVACRLNEKPASDCGLVESDPRGKYHLLLAASICRPVEASRVLVRVLNVSSETFQLPSGIRLGFYSSVTEDQIQSNGRTGLECASVNSAITEAAPIVPQYILQLYDAADEVCSDTEKVKVAQLLCKYSDIFSKDESDVGLTNLVSHGITLIPGAKPVKQHARRLGPEKEKEVERQVVQLQERGLIEPGSGAMN